MARFDPCLAPTLAFEGGYSDDPADAGGATNYGITLATLRAHRKDSSLTAEDVQALTVAEAGEIYKARYWNPLYDQLLDQAIAWKTFDMGVNMGPSQGVKILQLALNDLGYTVGCDGVFGAETLAAANAANPARLYASLCTEQLDFYNRLIMRKPSQEVFRRGWTRRATAPAPLFADAPPPVAPTPARPPAAPKPPAKPTPPRPWWAYFADYLRK
jgi:lysozyme family protein